jgi:hypothetical protein
MAVTALQLISRAWYLSSIIARSFETVSGDYATEGLTLLNALLDFKATDVRLIPYYNQYQSTFVAGQESYFIPNLYAVETMTFNIGDVRYPMTDASRIRYFGTGRVDNIPSLPFQWHLERSEGGSTIRVYYLPLQNYVFNLSGKFALTDVTLNQDMSTIYDAFYLEYLRYGLAEMMANEWDITFAPEKKAMLKSYEQKLLNVSPPDLTLNKVPMIQDKMSINWAQVNIGMGWTN